MHWKTILRSRYVILPTIALASMLVIYFSLPPWYRFTLGPRTADRDDAYALVALAADFKQVQQWNPRFVSPDAVSDLAAWITYGPNQSVVAISDLRRDDSPEFALVNGQILLLEQSGQGELNSLRKLQLPQLEAELLNRLGKCSDSRRDVSLAKVAHQAANRRLLDRCACSAFPESAGWLRRCLFGSAQARAWDRQRWVAGFTQAVERDVLPISQFYSDIDRQNIVTLNTTGSGQLRLMRRKAPGIPQTVYRGNNTTSDFELNWMESADSDSTQPVRMHDTGLRFVHMKWLRAKGDQKQLQLAWPPAPEQLAIRADRLQQFLVELGLPGSLLIRSSQIESKGTWESCQVALRVDVA
jgi:hypothetical protein